ncbi:hypothetical protein CDL12_26829 [Handroanthus impetiginosus]|uniref:Cyclin-dependent kinase inhibitor domain-containing protein n=1 Tax=Handroanthus impetiginosus TaxID=429701 RepID=A0A2G9G5S3_9LAMI|nr:hypothetical protein CDL12_26829 [Handroanthus impetiginosus]
MGISTSNGVFREGTPTSDLWGDSEQDILMDSSSATTSQPISPPPASPCKKISASAAKSKPSAAELEEFFSAAEKYVQKRFSEKYNYDIVKDVPLEGRYQWVRLHP